MGIGWALSPVKVGKRPGQALDAVAASHCESATVHEVAEERVVRGSERHALLKEWAGQIRVHAVRGAGKASCLPSTGCPDSLGDVRARFGRRRSGACGLGGRNTHPHVHSVHDRAGQARSVTALSHRGAFAAAFRPEIFSARARVGGEHKLEPRGIHGDVMGAVQPDLSLFKRLSKGFEHTGGELRRFVAR